MQADYTLLPGLGDTLGTNNQHNQNNSNEINRILFLEMKYACKFENKKIFCS